MLLDFSKEPLPLAEGAFESRPGVAELGLQGVCVRRRRRNEPALKHREAGGERVRVRTLTRANPSPRRAVTRLRPLSYLRLLWRGAVRPRRLPGWNTCRAFALTSSCCGDNGDHTFTSLLSTETTNARQNTG